MSGLAPATAHMERWADEATGLSDPKIASGAGPNVRRFVLAYIGFAIPIALLVGGVLALEFGHFGARYSAIEAAPRLAILSLVRAYGPAVSVSAAAFALVVWSHSHDEATVVRSRWSAAASALLVSFVGSCATISLAAFASFVALHAAFGLSWHQFAAATSMIQIDDLAQAGLSFGVDAFTLGIAVCFALPYLCRKSWSLPAKVAATWIGGALIRVAAGATFALVDAVV